MCKTGQPLAGLYRKEFNMKKVNILGSCVSRVSLLNGDTSGHGIYGEDMKQVYFLDKQNLVLSMMPSAFSQAEVDSVPEEVLYDKTRIKALRQCLDKSTLKLLMESDADYLVMDLYDFQNDFVVYKDTAFSTCAHEFMNTELFKRDSKNMKISNFMRMPTWIWYPYVDLFFEKIMAKYDADHIILLRFRSNRYYWAKDGGIKEIPETYRKPWHSNYIYNATLKRLEDYIINKYQPYVIDLSKFYMCSEYEWSNLNGAHFEYRFYRQAFKYITEVVTGKANTRYFAKPEFMWEGFGVPTEQEKDRRFDVEGALELLPKLVEEEDILWINLLHKLNIYAKDDPRVQEYTRICIGE